MGYSAYAVLVLGYEIPLTRIAVQRDVIACSQRHARPPGEPSKNLFCPQCGERFRTLKQQDWTEGWRGLAARRDLESEELWEEMENAADGGGAGLFFAKPSFSGEDNLMADDEGKIVLGVKLAEVGAGMEGRCAFGVDALPRLAAPVLALAAELGIDLRPYPLMVRPLLRESF